MNLRFLSVLCLGLFIVWGSPASAVAPREPLTFQNVGVYAGWDDYLVSKDNPFDYLIIQANVVDGKIWWHTRDKQRAAGDNRTWNEWLKIARANGKRVIADVGASRTIDGTTYSFQTMHGVANAPAIEQLFPMFDSFFEQVDEQELYAITLGEEHIFWEGQLERIVAVTEYLKPKYDVPLYQWWSPSGDGSRVGVTWPNLPGDGWMLDEYFLQQTKMESLLRSQMILQKPVFQIIWAAPEAPSVPWDPQTFWDQVAACRKYNVPIAFFNWHDRDDSAHTDTWGWDDNASPKARQVWEDYCLHTAVMVKRLPPVSQEEWEFSPYAPKVITLPAREGVDAIGVYDETFAKPRELKFIDDAQIHGLRNLKWDSSPLQLQPRTAGDAESKLIYTIEIPVDAKSITVEANGQGDVTIEAADAAQASLGNASMKDGKASLTIKADASKSNRVYVTFVMKGNAKKAGEMLAEISSLSISAGK